MSSHRLLDFGHPQQTTRDKISIYRNTDSRDQGMAGDADGGVRVFGEMREIVWGRRLSSSLVAFGS
jgi:hypothetical protein